MKNNFFNFLILILILSFCDTSAQVIKQAKKDSLQTITKQSNSLSKVKHYLNLSDKFSTVNLDSCLIYAQKAHAESNKIKSDSVYADVYNNLANSYEYKGMADSALVYHLRALSKRKILGNQIAIADSYNNLGVAYDQLGKFKEALYYYFKALKIYENQKDLTKTAMVNANIGIIYKQQKSFDKAYFYYKKANEIYVNQQDDFGIMVTSGNIGSVLIDLKRFEESISYSEKAQEGYEKLKYDRYVPYSISNIGIAYDSLKQFEQAEKMYQKSIDLHKKYGNHFETANILNALSTCLIKQKRFKESIAYSNESLAFINKTDAKKLLVSQLQNLAKAHAGLGDFNTAFSYSEQYNKIKDTLFENEKTKAIFELETRYETEKKEKDLANEKVKVTQRELELKRKNMLLYVAFGLGLTFLIIGYLLYKQQKLKNIQLKKESDLKAALVKIETQNKLQEQRLQISRDLHDNIGSQLTFIISSIDNLKYFDLAKEKLNLKFDSISGFTKNTIIELRDTIWAMNKNAITVEDLQIRIANFIENAQLATNGISFDFVKGTTGNTDNIFSSVEGMNIYRIIQEAINNAVKYANATHIEVTFSQEESGYTFVISDNGVGFSESEIQHGNGLNNMKKRALDLHANLMITSKTNEGTKVTLKKQQTE
ncbi:tetratricopeptide repeat-containing sensor histidine kinase [Flavobacterium orientale]|uniref:histidine kinase n=1 Tax=Flavobacterium orientale TaxID=1756020 RepID=A0A916XV01_9FLAO|nr:sensor histidine kinase [Flavobacterium orientale]GGD14357.1 two-component sensor histidine kinase [Flavobacterium orientale]